MARSLQNLRSCALNENLKERIKKLNAKTLKKKPYSKNPQGAFLKIVLCFLPENEFTPYVTWVLNERTQELFWGHYHESRIQAEADFDKRGEKNWKNLADRKTTF